MISGQDREQLSPRSKLQLANEPPGPAASLFGWRANVLQFFKNPIETLRSHHESYGQVARLVSSHHDPVFVQPTGEKGSTVFGFGPEINREILTRLEDFQTRTPRGPKTEAFETLSQNILFMNGKQHTDRRRLMMPTFSRDHLKSYHDDVIAYTANTLEEWRDGQQLDLLPEMSVLTMKIASRSLFGLDPSKDSRSLAVKIRKMVDLMFSPAAMIPIDLPGTPYRQQRLNMESIVAGLLTEIERKRTADQGMVDFLSMMIAAHDQESGNLSDTELVSQSVVMFFAGHDTASCALTWTLFLLAQHPEVMADLLDELEEHLSGDPPRYEQLYALPLLDRVIKESLRILSPGVMFPRFVPRETKLGAYTIRAGSELVYSPYLTHHDPEVFDQPNRFFPDRWLSTKPTAYEYLPFGSGARKCLGSGFGSMQLRIVLSMLLQRFRFELLPGTTIDPHVNVVMSPKQGMPMVVRRQDRQFNLSTAEVSGYIRSMVDL